MLIGQIIQAMSPAVKRHFLIVMVVMIVGALLEILLILSVLPFGAAISGAGTPLLGSSAEALLPLVHSDPLIASAILLTGSATLVMIARLILARATAEFVMRFGHDLAMKIFDGMIHSKYQSYIDGNSADLVARMSRVQDVTIGYVHPMMQAMVGLVLAIAISVCMLVLNPVACLVVGGGLGVIYFLLSKLTWPRLHDNSVVISDSTAASSRAVLNAHGGLRAIILKGSQPDFSALYRKIDLQLRTAAKNNAVLSSTPGFIVETVAVILLTIITVRLSQADGGFVAAVPILGALAIGAKRLLPLVTSAWQSSSIALGNTHTVVDIVRYLSEATDEVQNRGEVLSLCSDIRIEKVNFDYDPDAEQPMPVLKDVCCTIERGQHIGICGETGSGKTTFLDLVLGLLPPTTGYILIDGQRLSDQNRKAWQRNIGHVPQEVFLIDDTIAANIAFGCREAVIDMDQVQQAATLAQMDALIDSLPLGLNSSIGERGIKLSGGQQQRLGIARALFGKPSVLVLDEATSALDSATEARVMRSIADLPDDLTIITVAHRASTLQYCDQVFSLEQGQFSVSRNSHSSSPYP
tara:strand:+ start:6828 stop:8567 length:1740 start_codon:yes stop_codon:yes gene_type:complete